MIKQTIAEELRAKQSRDNRELLDRAADYIESLERESERLRLERNDVFKYFNRIVDRCYIKYREVTAIKSAAIKEFAEKLKVNAFLEDGCGLPCVGVRDIEDLVIATTKEADDLAFLKEQVRVYLSAAYNIPKKLFEEFE